MCIRDRAKTAGGGMNIITDNATFVQQYSYYFVCNGCGTTNCYLCSISPKFTGKLTVSLVNFAVWTGDIDYNDCAAENPGCEFTSSQYYTNIYGSCFIDFEPFQIVQYMSDYVTTNITISA
eukprot:TRINITY_DN11649_c0_g1_i1.p1 TRINITY_DN11649_c0_g1~~TRINITY_DN11649_c0_g1_i1.p1  ORF type:complete len:121 (+),score=5.15 TRINITY_DN11649_c0_g1_i1:33-395(+)